MSVDIAKLQKSIQTDIAECFKLTEDKLGLYITIPGAYNYKKSDHLNDSLATPIIKAAQSFLQEHQIPSVALLFRIEDATQTESYWVDTGPSPNCNDDCGYWTGGERRDETYVILCTEQTQKKFSSKDKMKAWLYDQSTRQKKATQRQIKLLLENLVEQTASKAYKDTLRAKSPTIRKEIEETIASSHKKDTIARAKIASRKTMREQLEAILLELDSEQ